MTTQAASPLAWSLWALFMVLGGTGLALQTLNGGVTIDDRVSAGVFILVATFGAFLASKRPGNPVGWLFFAVALGPSVGFFFEEYAREVLVMNSGSLPGGKVALGISQFAWSSILLLIFLFLLFPTGRLPSPRWRSFARVAAGATALAVVSVALLPGASDGLEGFDNPFGIKALETVIDVAGPILFPVLAVIAFIAFASLAVRYRRAGAVERMQLKWFMFAAAVSVVAAVFGEYLWDPVGLALFAIGVTALPLATTFAILRYRLYDIDRIINRTLVYGLLTVLLGGLYVGVVVGLGTLVGDSGLLVAASTLLVAALFRPARARVQNLIDRRFYRKKYDAQRTLESFSAWLRDEVDLDALSAELVKVVQETMQPAHASVWLRASGTALGRVSISAKEASRNVLGTPGG